MEAPGMLIDQHLPRFDVSLMVHTLVDATPEETYAAIENVDLLQDRLVALLVGARDLPRRVANRIQGKPEPRTMGPVRLRDIVSAETGWIPLGEAAGRELVAGLVGKFWHRDYGVLKVSPGDFRTFDVPGYAKTVADLSVRPYGTGRTLLLYESRTATTDEQAQVHFRRYWTFLRPFVFILMHRAVLAMKREAEALHAQAQGQLTGGEVAA